MTFRVEGQLSCLNAQNTKGHSTGMKNKCGDCHLCCIHYDLKITQMRPETISFARHWGVLGTSNDDSITLEIDEPCQHLTKDGCDDYENRPLTCREFNCDKMKEA